MAMPQIVSQVGAQLGVEVDGRHSALFGMKDGFPIQLGEQRTGNSKQLIGLIRFDDASQTAAVQQALGRSAIAQRGLKHQAIRVEDGMVSLRWPSGLTGYGKPKQVAAQFTSVFEAVKSAVREPGLKCRTCGSGEVNAPLLVNGVVDRLCPACLDQLAQQAALAQAAYDALPVRVGRMLLATVSTSLLGAGLWAGITAATNTMYWLVAIGIGAAIGWSTTKAAGKGALAVQVVTATATVAAVLIGQCLFVGHAIYQYAVGQGAEPALLDVALAVPGVLFDGASVGDLLFALGGGLVGAISAVARAARPKLDVSVER